MKDEIKIAGNQLQIGNTVYQLDYKVLDCITNLQVEKDYSDDYARHLHNENKKLQEENERLKDIINDDMTAYLKGLEDGKDKAFSLVKDYKSRIDKAIEYIKSYNNTPLCECDKANLLNILELIEEEKEIPEKLNELNNESDESKRLSNKINEIIDYLKSKGE